MSGKTSTRQASHIHLSPQVGVEPTTSWLTAIRSTTELLKISCSLLSQHTACIPFHEGFDTYTSTKRHSHRTATIHKGHPIHGENRRGLWNTGCSVHGMGVCCRHVGGLSHWKGSELHMDKQHGTTRQAHCFESMCAFSRLMTCVSFSARFLQNRVYFVQRLLVVSQTHLYALLRQWRQSWQ